MLTDSENEQSPVKNVTNGSVRKTTALRYNIFPEGKGKKWNKFPEQCP